MKVVIEPEDCQKIFESVAANRAQTRGTRIMLEVDDNGGRLEKMKSIAVNMSPIAEAEEL